MSRLEAYLASLPHGLDSYPQCQRKAVQYRQLLTPAWVAQAGKLPSVLAALVTQPLPVSAFFPAVHESALYLAARDLVFTSDEEFVAAIYRVSHELMSGPLYRIMMALLSPSMIVRGAASRFGAFNRGATLDAEIVDAHHARATLTFPAHVYPPLLLAGWASTFRAAVEESGGRDTVFDVVDAGPTKAVFDGRWR